MWHAAYWNWQRKDWPIFTYDTEKMLPYEMEYQFQLGRQQALTAQITSAQQRMLQIEMLSEEGISSAAIEGEYLDRHSVQSSLQRHFGMQVEVDRHHPQEAGMAALMWELYSTFSEPLSHEMLLGWHAIVMQGQPHAVPGKYRSSAEPMQVVSGPMHRPTVHFEAPPSKRVNAEMTRFIRWYNDSAPEGVTPLLPLTRAAITHLYFVSIHPFEDGNGRMARALMEKALAEACGAPTLTAVSLHIQTEKKAYYDALERNNKQNQIDDWLEYMAATLIQAQQQTPAYIEMVIYKTRLFDRFKEALNPRQCKALERILRHGKDGFKGGLSAKKYQHITGAATATATRDLRALVTLGILYRTGEKKGARYWLVDQLPE